MNYEEGADCKRSQVSGNLVSVYGNQEGGWGPISRELRQLTMQISQ